MLKRLPLDKFFLPKIPPVASMCDDCPFHPSGTGKGRDDKDWERIVKVAAIGGLFSCHKTVYTPATKFERGDPALGPNPPVQPHFRSCLGAVLYKKGELDLPDLPTVAAPVPEAVGRPWSSHITLPEAMNFVKDRFPLAVAIRNGGPPGSAAYRKYVVIKSLAEPKVRLSEPCENRESAWRRAARKLIEKERSAEAARPKPPAKKKLTPAEAKAYVLTVQPLAVASRIERKSAYPSRWDTTITIGLGGRWLSGQHRTEDKAWQVAADTLRGITK